MKSNIVVEGAAIELEASVRDEAYRIAAEAARNACIHSDGSILTIQINYGRDLIIAVSDHRKGSDVYYTSTRRNQYTMGSGECMNACATLVPAYRLEAFPTEELR
jgi:glucose-6-phosphate-specific signal transduction histidine kinase